MGLFKTFVNLLDEDSNQSFEKKLDNMLGQAEKMLTTTLDKAEHGIRSVDKVIDQVDKTTKHVVNKSDAAIKGIDHVSTKVIDVVNKTSENKGGK